MKVMGMERNSQAKIGQLHGAVLGFPLSAADQLAMEWRAFLNAEFTEDAEKRELDEGDRSREPLLS